MGSAVWNGEAHEYSAKAIERIGDPIWSKKGPEIQAAAEDYRVELLLRKEMPKAAQVNEELRNLSKSIRKVLDASEDLDELTLDAIQIWANGLSGGTTLNDVMVWRGELLLLALELEETADENSKSGQPRKEARRRFVKLLAEIWEEVHGEWPKRHHGFDTYNAAHEERGQFLEFVRACIAPVKSSSLRGVEGDVRYVTSLGKNRNQN